MRSFAHIIACFCVIVSCASCKHPDAALAPIAESSVRVDGEVRKPGIYHLGPDETIQAAVTRAGGLYEWPQQSGVRSPQLATVTSEGGGKTNVKRKEWGAYRLRAGDRLYINRNWL